MEYFVTYCVSDQDAGSNPLWHSCLLFSKTDETGKRLELVDNWGFYGLPTTGSRSSLTGLLKIKIGLDVDLKGNHGMLRHEELRFLDLGVGLHGVTFELSQQQFDGLQQKCKTMVDEQECAIKEIVESQGIKGKPQDKAKIYAYEQFSALLFEIEKLKAMQQGREPRLKPFELRVSFNQLWVPGLQNSNTCKSQAVSLLTGILSQAQIDRITEGGNHPTLPRFSGKMESMYLYSTGPIRQHRKSSGDIVYYRDGNDPDVKLFWTLPPQELEVLTEDTSIRLKIEDKYCSEIKSIVSKLQRLEWLFRNASFPEPYNHHKTSLIEQIIDSYKVFFNIDQKPLKEQISGWYGFAYSIFSQPRDVAECRLQDQIKEASASSTLNIRVGILSCTHL